MSSSRADQSDHASLFDGNGQRKYLVRGEGRRFLAAAATTDPLTRAFCHLLAYTGCRISEALAVTPRQLDAEAGRVVFLTLKRRRRVFRGVPVPRKLMKELVALARERGPDDQLWPWCRQTGWRHIKAVMAEAGIVGPQASPKGLRHQFGIRTVEHRIPPAIAQRWMGHAKPQSTAIYQQAVGTEERRLAARMWRGQPRRG